MKKYKYTKTFVYDGKRYFVYADTLEELAVKTAMRKRDLEEHKVALSGSMTVQEWSVKAIESYKANLKPNTQKKYQYKVDAWVLKYIGPMRIKDVKPVHLVNVMAKHTDKAVSCQIDVYQILRFLFRTACENEIIIKDPSINLKRPEGQRAFRREATNEEVEAFHKVLDIVPNFYVFEFMLRCGLRPAESYQLKREDFEIKYGKPIINVKGTKTKNARRIVPCPQSLYDRFSDSPPGYIFRTKTGNRITENIYKELVHRLKREMNIAMGCKMYRNKLLPPYPLAEDFAPYMFRHRFCSDHARRGTDIRICMKLMGHASIETTTKIYTHIQEEDLIKNLIDVGAL